MYDMLKRFLIIKNEIQFFSFDLNLEFYFTSEMTRNIEFLTEMLEPVKEAVLKLSEKRINLVAAEIIIMEALSTIKNLKEKYHESLYQTFIDDFFQLLVKRYIERRTIYTDILLFLSKGQIMLVDKIFYQEPLDSDIVSAINYFEINEGFELEST